MKVRALHTRELGFDELFVKGKIYDVKRSLLTVDGEVRRVLTSLNEVGKRHVISDNWLGYGDDFFENNFEFCIIES